jgi:hypothetical protein
MLSPTIGLSHVEQIKIPLDCSNVKDLPINTNPSFGSEPKHDREYRIYDRYTQAPCPICLVGGVAGSSPSICGIPPAFLPITFYFVVCVGIPC